MNRTKKRPFGFAEDAPPPARGGKRAVNLSVSTALLDAAKASGIKLSETLEAALKQRLAAEWAERNAKAIDAYNEDIRQNGLWSDEFRPW